MAEQRLLLSLRPDDLPALLEAVESYYEEIADECDKPDCAFCAPRKAALNRVRFTILDNAPKVMVKREGK